MFLSVSIATTTTEEEEEEEEPAGVVESGLGSGRDPLPSSSSDDSRSKGPKGVAKGKFVVNQRPESGRSQPRG